MGWLRPLLRGIVAELVEEYCGSRYRELEGELQDVKHQLATALAKVKRLEEVI